MLINLNNVQTDKGTFTWEPYACNLPRVSPANARRCLAHKTLAFVGDSGGNSCNFWAINNILLMRQLLWFL